MEEKSLEERLKDASITYMARTQGAEYIGDANDFLVFDVPEGLVFVKLLDTWDDVDKEQLLKDFEIALVEYLTEHDERINIQCRCDAICFNVIGDSRAIIKYIVNVGGNDE